MHLGVLLECTFVHHVCTASTGVRRGSPIPWNYRYKWLASVWVLRIEPGSPGRAVNVFNH